MQNLEYEIVFKVGDRLEDGPQALLKSDWLDLVVHPDGTVPIEFQGYETDKILVDSYQVHSIEHYLQCQVEVRQAVETEVGEARANWLGTSMLANPSDIWLDTRVDHLYITRKRLISADLQARLKTGLLSESQAQAVMRSNDQLETFSTFRAMVKVNWDEEHGVRLLLFRDGKFVRFDSI